MFREISRQHESEVDKFRSESSETSAMEAEFKLVQKDHDGRRARELEKKIKEGGFGDEFDYSIFSKLFL